MSQELIDLLKANPESFVSGQYLSEQLGVSRTAVWKQIQALKKRGYMFEAVPRLGYRLTYAPETLDVGALTELLETRAFGRSLMVVDKTASTQILAHEKVAEGAAEGFVVIAEEQTSGRGRMGRSWHSPSGKGLWFSLVLQPRISVSAVAQLTFVLCVAVCRTIRQLTGLCAEIKWPNDLLINGRKVSGILLESHAEDERLQYVVAGVGISVNIDRQEYPKDLRDKATSLYAEAGRLFSREALLAALLKEIEHLYVLFLNRGFAAIRLLWEAHSSTIGKRIETNTVHGVVKGTAVGMDDAGALLVETSSGETMRLFSGDIAYSSS